MVAALDEAKGYTDSELAAYSTTVQVIQAIADALRHGGAAGRRHRRRAAALRGGGPARRRNRGSPRGVFYFTSAQTDAAIAAAIAPYYTSARRWHRQFPVWKMIWTTALKTGSWSNKPCMGPTYAV